jgi:hypothetical protein
MTTDPRYELFIDLHYAPDFMLGKFQPERSNSPLEPTYTTLSWCPCYTLEISMLVPYQTGRLEQYDIASTTGIWYQRWDAACIFPLSAGAIGEVMPQQCPDSFYSRALSRTSTKQAFVPLFALYSMTYTCLHYGPVQC